MARFFAAYPQQSNRFKSRNKNDENLCSSDFFAIELTNLRLLCNHVAEGFYKNRIKPMQVTLSNRQTDREGYQLIQNAR